MQIGPAVSQTFGNFRELHGNYRSAVSALMETADRSGNILWFLIPLFQEGQLSVTGSMCTKYWLTA